MEDSQHPLEHERLRAEQFPGYLTVLGDAWARERRAAAFLASFGGGVFHEVQLVGAGGVEGREV